MTNRRSLSEINKRKMVDNKSDSRQLILMMSEDPLRSGLMYRQVEAFEEKVEMCFERFNVTLFYSMVRQLSQQTSIYDINSVRQLRQVYDDEMTRSNIHSVSHLSKCLQYFSWFCKFLTYLRNLRISFNSRIFAHLFKYFLSEGQHHDDRRGSTSSSLSKYSVTSFASSESGIMSDFGDSDRLDDVNEFDDGAAIARLQAQSQTALMLLSKEFIDIKTLYDTSDVKRVAQKLSFVMEQLEFNMDEDETIDPDLLSEESARVIEHLDADDEIDALLRYVPDILFKFMSATKLARKWLQLDDQRSNSFTTKLQKIMNLENEMSDRLTTVVSEIKQHELTLEKDSEELQRLLNREERSNDLAATVYDLDERIKLVTGNLKRLQKEKIIITNKLVSAVKRRMKTEYKTQKVLYESNRLKRHTSERQLATLQFRRDLAEADMHVEIGVKADLIRTTNDLQDKVECLERIIEEGRREENTIKSALIPVKMDREYLEPIVQPRGLPLIQPKTKPKPKILAEYVGSRNISPGKANHIKTHRNRLPQIRTRHDVYDP